jgi:hypothetical protein
VRAFGAKAPACARAPAGAIFRAFARHAGLQPAQQKKKRIAPGVAGPAIGQEDVRFRQRPDADHRPEGEVGRQDADDGAGDAVEGNGLTDDRRIGIERGSPQPIADDRRRVVIGRRGAGEERAAARRADAQRREEVRAHVERAHLQRLAAPGELRVPSCIGREVVERGEALAQRLVGHRRPGGERLDAGLGLLG